jgi:hypothetical protein
MKKIGSGNVCYYSVKNICHFLYFPHLKINKFVTCLIIIKKLLYFLSLALQPQFGPWRTSMKLSVSLRFTRS